MCKNAYEQLSSHTRKVMIFCKLRGTDGTLSQLCISQRYCPEKDKYIENNQKNDCKKYETIEELVIEKSK